MREANMGTEEMDEFFAFDHLPEHLREVSAEVWDLYWWMRHHLPPSREFSAGMRKLLEAKDCFVRAKVQQKRRELEEQR